MNTKTMRTMMGAAGLLVLGLTVLFGVSPAWAKKEAKAKKDKWGEVKPADPSPVTSYTELRGRIVLPLIGELVLEKGGFAKGWTARLSDAAGASDLEVPVSATGSFVFPGVNLSGAFKVTVTDPQKRPLGLAAWREKFVTDHAITVDERSSVVVKILDTVTGRQGERPSPAEFEKPAHEKRMTELVQIYGEAVRSGGGIDDAAFNGAVDGFVTALLAPPENAVATESSKTGTDTGAVTGAPGEVGLSPVDAASTGTTTGAGTVSGTSTQSAAGTGAVAGTSTGATQDQPPAATTVTLSQQVSYLKTVATQIRLTGSLGDWNGTVQLPTMKGGTVTFSRSNALSSEGKVVLLYKGLNIANLEHFSQLSFTEPVPSGTVVEVYDLDNDRAVATANVP